MKANEPIKQSFDRAFVGFVTSSRLCELSIKLSDSKT